MSAAASYKGLRLVEIEGQETLYAVLNKTGSILIFDDNERQVEDYNIVAGAVLTVPDGGRIKKGEILTRVPITSPFFLKRLVGCASAI